MRKGDIEMLGFVWRVLVGRFTSCSHKWTIKESAAVQNWKDEEVGKIFVLQCEKCGEITTRRADIWS